MMRTGLVSIPPRSAENPYQILFYRELEKYGFEIHDYFDFRLPDIIKNYNKIHVLHFHWYPAPEDSVVMGYLRTFFFVMKLALVKVTGIKIVWTAHNFLPHDTKYYRLQFIRRWILVHMCDVIIVHFERAKDMLHDMFKVAKRKMICMHHGLYEGYYPNSISIQSARAALDIPANATVFLCFGQIRRYKNVEGLISGFISAANEHKDIILLLVGKSQDNAYKQELLELIASHKQIKAYFEFIPDTDVQLYFSASDCCVLPYKDIFTSGSVMLALTYRKPVIMRKCDFSDEYLTSENSLLLDDVAPCAIKESIEHFYRNKKLFQVTEEFTSRYKWEDIVSKTIVDKFLDAKSS